MQDSGLSRSLGLRNFDDSIDFLGQILKENLQFTQFRYLLLN